MKVDTLRKRLADGKSVSYVCQADGVEGLIELWVNPGKVVLTWEERPPGEQYNESNYTRDERHLFDDVESALTFLRARGIDPTLFSP